MPEEILMTRKPWVMLDRILTVDPARIRCQKYISSSDYFLIGHFPARSIYPGVMLVTGLVQAAEMLLRLDGGIGNDDVLRLSAVDVHLLATALPGDILTLEIEHVGDLAFRGVVEADDCRIARGTFKLFLNQSGGDCNGLGISDPPPRNAVHNNLER